MNNIVVRAVSDYLTKLYKSKTSIKEQEYKIFGKDEKYVFIPIEKLGTDLGLSAYQQRNVLSHLETNGIIKTKLGQKRSRYFTLLEDESEEAILRKRLNKLLLKLNNSQLRKVIRVVEAETK